MRFDRRGHNILSFQTEDELSSFLESLPHLPLYSYINETVLINRDAEGELFRKISKNPKIELLSQDPFKIAYYYKKSIDNNLDVSIPTIFLRSKIGDFYRAINITYSEVWKKFNHDFIKRYYPLIQPVFFKQNELEHAFNQLELNLGPQYRVRISDLTIREDRLYENDANRNPKHLKILDTKRWWTDLSVLDVFNLAKDETLWISSLKFSIQKKVGRLNTFQSFSSGRLLKNGSIHFNGSFDSINNFLISNLEKDAIKRLKIFENRGLRERHYSPSEPIEINYLYEIFSTPEDVKKVGDILSKYPNSSRIVYHCNPYYHASIADFIDGSSFDIWVLSTKKMILVPQAKSSVQAFERITSYIFANLGEGVIDEFTTD